MPNGKLSITVSSTIQTITVGIGITPIQSYKQGVADYTADREFHPAPKNTAQKYKINSY